MASRYTQPPAQCERPCQLAFAPTCTRRALAQLASRGPFQDLLAHDRGRGSNRRRQTNGPQSHPLPMRTASPPESGRPRYAQALARALAGGSAPPSAFARYDSRECMRYAPLFDRHSPPSFPPLDNSTRWDLHAQPVPTGTTAAALKARSKLGKGIDNISELVGLSRRRPRVRVPGLVPAMPSNNVRGVAVRLRMRPDADASLRSDGHGS